MALLHLTTSIEDIICILNLIIFIPQVGNNILLPSEIGTKLRDWAVGQAWGSCYSLAAVSSNDSKTLYHTLFIMFAQ